jgi:CheY-like chemotaxis protein
MNSRIWDTRTYQNRLNLSVALVIEEAADFRDSLMALLRKRGWLVHGTSRADEALSILAHFPYDLIVLDSELPGICGIDFIHILQNLREWRAIRVVVITSTKSASFASQVAECGAFLARRSTWEDDLFGFLSTYGGNSQTSNAFSHS